MDEVGDDLVRRYREAAITQERASGHQESERSLAERRAEAEGRETPMISLKPSYASALTNYVRIPTPDMGRAFTFASWERPQREEATEIDQAKLILRPPLEFAPGGAIEARAIATADKAQHEFKTLQERREAAAAPKTMGQKFTSASQQGLAARRFNAAAQQGQGHDRER